MIDIPDDDIVALRHTSAGRFILFTSTDLPAACPIPWWGATVDTGGDGHGLLVRLDERSGPEGWTALDLLAVARGRAVAEDARRGGILAAEIARHLAAAIGIEAARGGAVARAIAFRPGGMPSPYPWTVAARDAFELPLCPDPESRDEGIAPEALLIVVEQLLADAGRAFPRERRLRDARRHVTAAIATEVARVMAARRSTS
jgi:hypothetical protein